MIRTSILPCKLNKAEADKLNLESGRIYTSILVNQYRVMRKKGVWLSEKSGTRVSDIREKEEDKHLHAHSIDAAQQGFYKACKTAKVLKRIDPNAKYPHWRKKFRTTIWKNTAIRYKDDTLFISNGKNNPGVQIKLPEDLRSVLRFLEVRLVYDHKKQSYNWHIVVENGKQPKLSPGNNIVSVDLGEVHPAVIGDEEQSTIILCRERRHEVQGHAKRMASIAKAISHKKKGSRAYRRLTRTKSRMKAKHNQVMHDIEHKVSRAIVDVAIERKANIIAIGDVRNISDGVNLGKQTNQKVSIWNHGKIKKLVEYKAEAEGIKVELVNEAYTSQTCPSCSTRHKPKGRNYRCPSCGYQAHRDVVGQLNILSVFKFGEPGKIPAIPNVKHRLPYDVRLKRRRLDTGQGNNSVARGVIS